MRLTLRKQAAYKPQWCIRGAGYTQFAEALLISVNALNILVRVHQIACVVVEVIAISRQRVIEISIIGVIRLRFGPAAQMATRCSDVPATDLALNSQCSLNPLIAAALWVVLNGLKIAGGLPRTFLRIAAFCVLDLPHQCWLDRPAVIKINSKCQTRAVCFGVVIVFLNQSSVALRNAGRSISSAARNIVNITAIIAIPSDKTRSRAFSDWDVDEAFVNRAEITMRDVIEFNASAAVETRWIGRVRDQLQRASHRACTI